MAKKKEQHMSSKAVNRRSSDNTMVKRRSSDNTMVKRKRTKYAFSNPHRLCTATHTRYNNEEPFSDLYQISPY
jgi:hypothetical protein